MFRVTVAELHRLVANARILERVKSEGAFFYGYFNYLEMYSADATTLIKDRCEMRMPALTEDDYTLSTDYGPPFTLTTEALKGVNTFLCSDDAFEDETIVQITVLDSGQLVHLYVNENNFTTVEAKPADVEKRTDFDNVLNPNHNKLPIRDIFEPYYIHPSRYRKLSLVKPGDYPLGFKHVYYEDAKRHIILFKAGPTVRGVLDLLDTETLKDQPGSKEWLWS